MARGTFWADQFADLKPATEDPRPAQHWALARGLPLPADQVASPVAELRHRVSVDGLEPERAAAGNKQEAGRLAATPARN